MTHSAHLGGLNAGLEGLMAAGLASAKPATVPAGKQDFRSTLEPLRTVPASLPGQPISHLLAAVQPGTVTRKPETAPVATTRVAPGNPVPVPQARSAPAAAPLAPPAQVASSVTQAARDPNIKPPVKATAAVPVPAGNPPIPAAIEPVHAKPATADPRRPAEVGEFLSQPMQANTAVIPVIDVANLPTGAVPARIAAPQPVPVPGPGTTGKLTAAAEAKPSARRALNPVANSPGWIASTPEVAGKIPPEKTTGATLAEAPASQPAPAIGPHLAAPNNSLAMTVPSNGQTSPQSSTQTHAAAGPSTAPKPSFTPDHMDGGAPTIPGLSDSRTLISNANVLEVGLTGGAHGWLRIRAEMGHTGEVTASLVASNAGSAATLTHQLGAISDYLKSETVGVSSLVVTAPEKNSGANLSTHPPHLAGSTSGGHAPPQGRDRSDPSRFGIHSASSDSPPPADRPASYQVGVASGVGSLPGSTGGWVNVRV